MSQSEGAPSSKRTRSSVAHSTYLNYRLIPNAITYSFRITGLALNTHQTQAYNEVTHLLEQLLDESAAAQLSDDPIASQNSFKTQTNGHHDIELVKTGYRLCSEAEANYVETEDQWTLFWLADVWRPLGLTSLCNWTSNLLWRPYDASLKQIQPSRSKLVIPKPDMAFGFKIESTSTMASDILEWTANSSPSVDLHVNTKLCCPFFVFESKTNNGSTLTGENQIGNALVMMHDILCALEVNDTLPLFALLHAGNTCTPYISFSKRAVTRDGKTYCKKIHVVRLEDKTLNKPEDMIACLRFIKHVRDYGLGIYKETVEEALRKAKLARPPPDEL